MEEGKNAVEGGKDKPAEFQRQLLAESWLQENEIAISREQRPSSPRSAR